MKIIESTQSQYMKHLLYLSFLTLFSTSLWANPEPDAKVVYKKVGDIELALHLFFPENHKTTDKLPTIVFFHGGGWRGGGLSQFYRQSNYFASRGMVAISVQYRTEKSHGTSPKECVKDGKSAIRWIRSHASEYGINPDKIIAGGGSAGGHIAAAVATLKGFNEAGEDTTVSCIPKALVLFNPVADNSEEGYGYDRVKAYWKAFSPAHNLNKGTPPTLIMLGTKDKLFNVSLAKQYQQKMEEIGSRCDLILYEGEDHAFFNNDEMFNQTVYDADVFLASLGFINGVPTISKIN